MNELSGRVAIITGGASGIGAAIVRAFRAAGAQVVAVDRSDPGGGTAIDDLLAADPDGVVLETMDVTDADAVAALAADVAARHGRIDILVNSVGYSTHSRVVDMSLEDWNRVIDVNLTATFLTVRAVLPHMIARRWGRIINIASQLGQIGSAEVTHFCAAKAAVIGFSRALAREVVGDGVLVNVIAPGPVNTPALEREPEEWKRAKLASLPLGRFGEVDEIAPTALLLASDAGSFYVGQTLGPNGGDHMP